MIGYTGCYTELPTFKKKKSSFLVKLQFIETFTLKNQKSKVLCLILTLAPLVTLFKNPMLEKRRQIKTIYLRAKLHFNK